MLLGLALLGTPAPFATLERPLAGQVVAHIFLREAWLSLGLGVLLLLLERRRSQREPMAGEPTGSASSPELLLVLGTVFCTVAGYFGVQPMMPAARLGQGPLSFGQLHAVSFGLFGLKIVLLLVLAWRAARAGRP